MAKPTNAASIQKESGASEKIPLTELTIDTVLETVSQKFQVAKEDITGSKDSQNVLEARYAFVYLSFRLVHAVRMRREEEKQPGILAKCGFAVMRHYQRVLYEELASLFGIDVLEVRDLDNQAIRLREENGEFCEKTERLWAELDNAYGLNMSHSPTIWLDRVDK